MPNEGIFELILIDVKRNPVRDTLDVEFRRASDGKAIREASDLSFPPTLAFRLPAFPQAINLYCDITPTRFRMRKSGFFTLTDGETIRRELTVMRLPSQWRARFERWAQLPARFDPLKTLLLAAPDVKVKEKSGTLGRFAEAAYDDVDDQKTIEAKTSLLNLFVKLTELKAPGTSRNWFSYLRSLLQIGRERLIAVVDPKMGQIVRRIKDDVSEYPDYRNTPAGNHYGNIPAGYQAAKSDMFSIKSSEDNGNLQLTLAPARDPAGDEVLLLDSDIDENGRLLEHLADVFKHKFTGGTHSFDIHEYLSLAHPSIPLGYDLV